MKLVGGGAGAVIPSGGLVQQLIKDENKIKRCQQQLQTRVQLGASWQPLPFPQQPIIVINCETSQNQLMSNFEQIFSSANNYKIYYQDND